eukprot:NODE_234_length_12000_cov_0.516343.p12 type:complete len:110 gc:universal NODE_234_length_12000_cov_0.516343:10578-10249(-)
MLILSLLFAFDLLCHPDVTEAVVTPYCKIKLEIQGLILKRNLEANEYRNKIRALDAEIQNWVTKAENSQKRLKQLEKVRVDYNANLNYLNKLEKLHDPKDFIRIPPEYK